MDGSSSLISTTDGYLMVVHDLHLNHLGRDLLGFNASHYYEHLYHSKMPKPLHDMFQDSFTARRNRIEYINDFPMDDEPNMVPSLEVHPQDWCVVSRCSNNDRSCEWTCVHHDIQGKDDRTGDGNVGKTVRVPRRRRIPSTRRPWSGLPQPSPI